MRSKPDLAAVDGVPSTSFYRSEDEINAWIYQSRHGYSVREVLDESHQVFQPLLAAIEALPEEELADVEKQ